MNNVLINKEQSKQKAALSAIELIQPGMILGIGSGSTVNYFIDALKPIKNKIDAVVAASLESEKRLKALSIPVTDLNSIDHLELYIDGADEINSAKQMLKGGGGALTREKIIAAVAKKFVCLIDPSKEVDLLGTFPVALEVVPMARSYVAREIVKLGGDPMYRQGFITDNGNIILDVYNLKLLDPISMEEKLNNITGIVTNGIFAKRRADTVIIGK